MNLIFTAFATLEGYREGSNANLGSEVFYRCIVKAVQEAIKKEKADKKKALQRASADKERALQKAAAERKQELLDEKISIARKFLMDGIPVDSILKCIDGLDRAEIEALK